jgi:hypothetical protein
MFNSRDFLRVEYNVLSKNVNRDVSQSEKTLSFNEIIEALDLWTMLLLIPIILKVVANHHRVKFCHQLIRCVLSNYFRYIIKLIMADVGRTGVSGEQSRRIIHLIVYNMVTIVTTTNKIV